MSISYLFDKKELTFIAAVVCKDKAVLPGELAAEVAEGDSREIIGSLVRKGLAIMRGDRLCIEYTAAFLTEQMCTAESVSYNTETAMYVFKCSKLFIAAGTDRLNSQRCRIIPFKDADELEVYFRENSFVRQDHERQCLE